MNPNEMSDYLRLFLFSEENLDNVSTLLMEICLKNPNDYNMDLVKELKGKSYTRKELSDALVQCLNPN